MVRACLTVPRRCGAERRRRGDDGAVTAETAMVLPLLVAVTVGLVWLLSLGVAQVRTVDAARETARALARDEPSTVAVGLGRQVAPEGARIEVTEAGGTVTVRVTSEVRGPGGLFDFVPSVTVDAQAVALAEEVSP